MMRTRAADNAYIFCEPRGRNADLVLSCRLCYVILDLYPYNNGRLMVVPRRHVRDLASTTAEERAELMALTRLSGIALVEAYTPHGINAGVNLGRPAGAGVLDHLFISSTLERRHELHVGRRKYACAARGLRIRRAASPIFERLVEDNG